MKITAVLSVVIFSMIGITQSQGRISDSIQIEVWNADEDALPVFSSILKTVLLHKGLGSNSELIKSEDLPLKQIARMFLRSSISHWFYRGGKQYVISYNWPSDLFFLFVVKSGKINEVGIASASLIAREVYKYESKKPFLDMMLSDRQNLVMTFFQDILKPVDPEPVFARYLYDPVEYQLVRGNIVGTIKLVSAARKDECRQKVLSFVRENARFGTSRAKADELYIATAFPVPAGRALAFLDNATNRKVGYVFLDAFDEVSCQPKALYTSVF